MRHFCWISYTLQVHSFEVFFLHFRSLPDGIQMQEMSSHFGYRFQPNASPPQRNAILDGLQMVFIRRGHFRGCCGKRTSIVFSFPFHQSRALDGTGDPAKLVRSPVLSQLSDARRSIFLGDGPRVLPGQVYGQSHSSFFLRCHGDHFSH